MSRLDRNTLRRMIIEEVALAREEAAARSVGISRERVREIVLEEITAVKRERLLGEGDMRTSKYSLVTALLGEADDKSKPKASAKSPAAKPVFEDGGKGLVRVGSHLYNVMTKNPADVTYAPDFGANTATKVVVRPDAVAAFFPANASIASKLDVSAATIDFDAAQDFMRLGYDEKATMAVVMSKLAKGEGVLTLPLKGDLPLVHFVESKYLATVKREFEMNPPSQGAEDEG